VPPSGQSGTDRRERRRILLDTTPLRASAAFRRLWIGQTTAAFGSRIAAVAALFQVWQLTGSTVWTGVSAFCQALPVIGFGLFGGHLADRHDRRRILLVATVGQGATAMALAVCTLPERVPILVLVALLATGSGMAAADISTSRAALPRLLEPAQIAPALALIRIAGQAATLVGPAVAGLVLAWSGPGLCYLLDALGLVLACGVVLRLPSLPAPTGAGQPAQPAWAASLAGLRFMVDCPPVRAALATDLSTMVLAMPLSLFPALNAERFGDDPATLGFFVCALGVGGVLASTLSGSFTSAADPGP